MKIRCRHCGEYFYPDEETIELVSEGWIFADSVNTCDECWELIEHLQDNFAELYSYSTLMDIQLLDHLIIIPEGKYYSIADKGVV
jgi:hypothetical protein